MRKDLSAGWTTAIEMLLFHMGHDLPEAEVINRLSILLIHIHNRFLANSGSPKCDSRKAVCDALMKAYLDLNGV
jgi:hypothetical protein